MMHDNVFFFSRKVRGRGMRGRGGQEREKRRDILLLLFESLANGSLLINIFLLSVLMLFLFWCKS
jgi:hypothetical protein